MVGETPVIIYFLSLNFFNFFATFIPVSLTFCFSDFNAVVPTFAFGIDAFTFTNESISISFLGL